MPLLPLSVPFIDVPVRPVTIGGVLFQRLTRYLTHYPVQDPETGNMDVFIKVQVRHFLTNDDGTAGADASELVKPYPLIYRTLATELVDAGTGDVVLARSQETDEQWAAKVAAEPRPLVPRGNAYGLQMHKGPVAMVPQIEDAMRAADGPPWYRFGGNPTPLALPHGPG